MDDLISKQTVLDIVDSYSESRNNIEDVTQDIISDIMSLPPVNSQEPKTGHWIRWYEQIDYDWDVDYIPHCKCSECGKEYDPHSSQFIKYCNECGAKMSEIPTGSVPQERSE